jgi:hypothetical protein
MDVPGVDTGPAQLKAIHDPAVDLGTLPSDVFQSYPFEITASLLNPWGGSLIDTAQLRLVVDAPDALKAGDVTAMAADGQSVPFTVDAEGNLVGRWGPDTGFAVAAGYNVSTTFTVKVADGAPVGPYAVTLELIDVDDPATVLAQESGTIDVNANATTVLWGSPLPKYATQGVSMTLPLSVYSPAAGTANLTLTVTGPGDDPTTPQTEVTKAGDVKVYASNGADMVAMPLSLNGEGQLVGTWNAPLKAGYTPVTWYATVAEVAPVGNYAFEVGLTGGKPLDPILVSIFAPETNGQQPPTAGEDTTPPVLTVTPVDTLGSTASFNLTANEDAVTFECMLTTDGVPGSWESCTSPKTYTGLAPGDYVFSARATDRVGNVSAVVTRSWTVEPPADTTAPTVTVTAVDTLGATATFTLVANEPNVTFQCQLTKNGRVTQAWAACISPISYTKLSAGTYVLSVQGTDAAGNISDVVDTPWTVTKATRK